MTGGSSRSLYVRCMTWSAAVDGEGAGCVLPIVQGLSRWHKATAGQRADPEERFWERRECEGEDAPLAHHREASPARGTGKTLLPAEVVPLLPFCGHKKRGSMTAPPKRLQWSKITLRRLPT